MGQSDWLALVFTSDKMNSEDLSPIEYFVRDPAFIAEMERMKIDDPEQFLAKCEEASVQISSLDWRVRILRKRLAEVDPCA